jgi:hypothetical protein
MATYTSNPSHIRVGAGALYWAPLGTSEPTTTLTSGKFTSTMGAGWVNVGATDNGHTFNHQAQTADIVPEESFYPEVVATTGITEDIAFSMLYMSPDNWLLAFNGGTTTTSTGMTTYGPPVPGAEVNRMLLWQSNDDTERYVIRAVFNNAQISVPRQKAPNKALLACTFRILQPASGLPWNRYSADATIGAVGSGG